MDIKIFLFLMEDPVWVLVQDVSLNKTDQINETV
jgi:hypothetical protein